MFLLRRRRQLSVSSDGIFEQSVLDRLCEAHGVKLILFESLQALTDDLRKHLDKQEAQEWSGDEKLAEEAVNRELSKIHEFLEANLEVSTRMGFYGSRHIQGINRIEIAKITRVETSLPSHRTPGMPVAITAQLEINIYATVRLPRPSPYLTEKLKVGEVRQPTRLADRIDSLYIDKDDILPRAVTVEIEAFRQGDKYRDLTPLSVSFGTSKSRRSVYKPFGLGPILESI